MYFYRVKKEWSQLAFVFVATVLVVALSGKVSLYILPMPFTPYLISAAAIGFMIYVFSKYGFKRYEYVIINCVLHINLIHLDGEEDCVLSVPLEPYMVHTRNVRETRGLKCVNCKQNFLGRSTFLLYTVNGERRCLIYEPDGDFIASLDRSISILKTIAENDTEDGEGQSQQSDSKEE